MHCRDAFLSVLFDLEVGSYLYMYPCKPHGHHFCAVVFRHHWIDSCNGFMYNMVYLCSFHNLHKQNERREGEMLKFVYNLQSTYTLIVKDPKGMLDYWHVPILLLTPPLS